MEKKKQKEQEQGVRMFEWRCGPAAHVLLTATRCRLNNAGDSHAIRAAGSRSGVNITLSVHTATCCTVFMRACDFVTFFINANLIKGLTRLQPYLKGFDLILDSTFLHPFLVHRAGYDITFQAVSAN